MSSTTCTGAADTIGAGPCISHVHVLPTTLAQAPCNQRQVQVKRQTLRK